jgi:8-oxo-dGTP pyrophosphatase MutT (NUDIX family)
MYKVYINNKPVIFTDDPSHIETEPGVRLLNSPGKETIREAVDSFFNDAGLQKLIIAGKSTEKLFSRFASLFVLTEAAGGLVYNTSGQYLFIFRRGFWDLPKGKAKTGEGIMNTAYREVEEETGISNLSVTRSLGCTYHTYQEAEVMILKRTYWFEMKSKITRTPVPQKSEDITQARWLEKSEIRDVVLKNTYRTIKDLMEEYLGV